MQKISCVCTGPFSVLPGQARAAPASPQQGEEGGEVQPTPAPTIVTHFAPEHLRPQLEHATKVFPLAFHLFETFLGAHFPYRAVHQVQATIYPDIRSKVLDNYWVLTLSTAGWVALRQNLVVVGNIPRRMCALMIQVAGKRQCQCLFVLMS